MITTGEAVVMSLSIPRRGSGPSCSSRSLALVGIGLAGCTGRDNARPSESRPAPAEPTAVPEDIEAQVHSFCRPSCHAYPPADAFPKSHWRMEVERGFRFFDKSGLSLNPPKLGHVVRYLRRAAPGDYAPAKIVPAAKPLDIQFERLAYPPTPPDSKPMISNIQVVRMQPPGVTDPAAIAREPFTLLASDMKDGRILALKPRDAAPAWKEIAKVPHPAHTQVIDLDGDGILDILVADLGSFPPTDRRCGSVVWLRGKPDGSFEPVTLALETSAASPTCGPPTFAARGNSTSSSASSACTTPARSSFWRTRPPTGPSPSSCRA